MTVFSPREPGVARIAITPDTAGKLTKLGLDVVVEKGLGQPLGWSDEQYTAKGARIADDPAKALAEACLVVHVDKPSSATTAAAKGALQVSSLDPFRERALVDQLAAAG
ncbi:MAG: NAD(P)(+) transhydrogenase (Re/Si-specific) subunit alpha, partial [Chthoniobacterales bacterium]